MPNVVVGVGVVAAAAAAEPIGQKIEKTFRDLLKRATHFESA
jgi:hypothetical protein